MESVEFRNTGKGDARGRRFPHIVDSAAIDRVTAIFCVDGINSSRKLAAFRDFLACSTARIV